MQYPKVFWDSNFSILLNNGEKIEVIYPERVGCEYDTPWLAGTEDGSEGSRSWGDTQDFLNRFKDHQLGYNPKFVIGEWGTRYHQPEGVKQMVSLDEVAGIGILSSDKYEQGMNNWLCEQEAAKEAALNDPNRTVTLRELNEVKDELKRMKRLLNIPPQGIGPL